ncbi:hypothetical protein EVAR_77241_1 [Eumeta japonica]|uniref:Uncharacterized protein n=1 Tax=Eumeta variegata TaxID=151549 RepID=A0A4C1ZWZ1_EUMVA|nr:hypothetical protein EVAR_77241_1 [Eumeta japonica]
MYRIALTEPCGRAERRQAVPVRHLAEDVQQLRRVPRLCTDNTPTCEAPSGPAPPGPRGPLAWANMVPFNLPVPRS